jgi:hypothetical protein
MRVSGQGHDPAALPPGKTRYPLYRRLGGTQTQSGQVRKISPPPEIDSRTVHLVGSRYADYDVFGWGLVQTSIGTPSVPSQIFRELTQVLQVNAGISLQEIRFFKHLL